MGTFIVEKIDAGLVTLKARNSNYCNTFKLASGTLTPGQHVRGRIVAPAWKVDTVALGGNFVEPLAGRPRRMQGTVLSVSAATHEVSAHVGYDVTVKLPDRYALSDYAPGARIAWDNIDLPTFTPEP